MTFGQKLKHYRNAHNLTQEELARQLSTSKQVISRYEKDQRSPKVSVASQYAEKLGLSAQYLMNNGIEPLFQELDIFSIPGIEPMPKTHRVPILGSIACGQPVMAQENIEDYINIPEGVRADFVLRCKGDSMIDARIYDGDYVFIRKQSTVTNGEIAAVLIDDEATLKRFYYHKEVNMVILRPENRQYDEMTYREEEINNIRVLGKAVAFLSEI